MAKRGAATAETDTQRDDLELLGGSAGTPDADRGEGSAGEDGTTITAPELVTVLVGGKPVKVAPEVAESFAAEQEAYRRERARLTQELETRSKPPPTPTDSAEPQEPDPELALQDFREYHRRYGAYSRHQLLKLEERLENRHREFWQGREKATAQQRALEDFFARVGRTHQVLDGERDLVSIALRRVAERHPDVQVTDPSTVDLVAEEALKEITRWAGKGKGSSPRPPQLEGQSRGSTPSGKTTTQPPRPVSIAEIQRARREQRRRGATRRGEEE